MTSMMRNLVVSSRPKKQLETIQNLVIKHLQDNELADFARSDDFTLTSMERGLQNWEHQHLVTALDILNAYQRDRRARTSTSVMGTRVSMKRSFKSDPRTRLVEILKRWLRSNAASASIGEDDVHCISSLCRDLLNHPQLFPSRNPRSFLRTLAEVYDHIQWQLREVLQRDRTCADLAGRVVTLSRNLLSDAIGYLLLAATDLKQTDDLPSVEVVALWQSLPSESSPVPSCADKTLQKKMSKAWSTQCGSLVAALLSTPWSVSLFDNGGREESQALVVAGRPVVAGSRQTASAQLQDLLAKVSKNFNEGNFKDSALAGAFQQKDVKATAARQCYLEVVELVFDLVYLLGEVMVHFHQISDGLGDYGMIRVAPWLHPFLSALSGKVQQLKGGLECLKKEAETAFVLDCVKSGKKVKGPAPSERMCARAHERIERAVLSRTSHAHQLLSALEDLKARSAPERLPQVVASLGDACSSLHGVLVSAEFRERVGAGFPDLPPLVAGPLPTALPAVSSGSSGSFSSAEQFRLAGSSGSFSSVEQFAGGSDEEDAEGAWLSLAPSSEASGAQMRASSLPARAGHACRAEGVPEANPFAEEAATHSRSEPAARPFREEAGCRPVPHQRASSTCRPESGLQLPAEAQPCPIDEAMRFAADDRAARSLKESQPPPAAMRWEVTRLTSTSGGWQEHDQRSLQLLCGSLQIFKKNSRASIKMEVDLSSNVEGCTPQAGGVVTLSLRDMPLRGSSMTSFSLSRKRADGVKLYFFRFDSDREALEFQREILSHQTWRAGQAPVGVVRPRLGGC